MKKDIYDGLVSKLATQVPWFAKPIIDMAIRRAGKASYEEVSPIEMLDIIRNDIDPRVASSLHDSTSILTAGAGFLLTDEANRIAHISPVLKTLIAPILPQQAGQRGTASWEAFLHTTECHDLLGAIGLVKRASEVPSVEVKEFYSPELRRQLNVTMIRVAGNQGGEAPCLCCVVQDTTLRAEIERSAGDFVRDLHGVKTRLEQTNERLQQSEQRFQELAANAQEWFWAVDAEGLYTYASPVVEEILGYAPEEIVGRKHFYDLFAEEERDALRQTVAVYWEERRSFRSFVNQNLHKDGTPVWLSTSGVPIIDDAGQIVGYRGVDLDITHLKQVEAELERRREALEEQVTQRTAELARTNQQLKVDIARREAVEQALLAEKQRWQSLVQNAPDMIMTVWRDGTVQFVNRDLPGISATDVLGRSLYDFLSVEHRDMARRTIEEVFRTGRPGSYEASTTGADGTTATHFTRVGPIKRLGSVEAVMIIATDTTERRQMERDKARLEEQFRQAQKMEAIGTLAGGVAHDMNNMLAAIMGLASAVQNDLTPEDPLQNDIEGILAASKKGHDLTRNLLGFARKGRYRKESIDLNHMIDSVTDLLRRTLPKRIAIETKLQSDLAAIEGDPGQINQVLVNIAINAADAMSERGTLTFHTEEVVLDQGAAAPLCELKPGRYVRLSVRDTGAGMDAETLTHAFEPFFTTKPTGQGTGLGLSMVYGTVQNHGGSVTLVSQQDRGTTVVVHLPVAGEVQQPSEACKPGAIATGSGTILLVDDEELVLASGKRLLEKLGYAVIVADGGEAALRRYQERRDEIDLVILDLMMPGMDGEETFRRLKEVDPDARILPSSGYTRERLPADLFTLGAQGFVQKPYDLKQVSEEIERMLLTRRAVAS